MIKHITLTLLALSSIRGSHFLSSTNKENCLCWPREHLSIPDSMNGVDTQRLVVYLYKSAGQQNIRVHIPNAVKQRLLPDFPIEDDDELIDNNEQLTLQGIFGNSKVDWINHKSLYNVPGEQMHPGLNRHLNYQTSNQFSKGVNIPNGPLDGKTYPNGVNFVNQFTPNIPFFRDYLHNNGKNPNVSGNVKITQGSINGPLHNTGKFNAPLNIYSEVNNKPNNLLNHGIDLINGPEPSNPNYSGTINFKHNYPIQGGINDPSNLNFSGDIKITHGTINGPLQHSGKLNVPLNIHSGVNSRPNNLVNHEIDLINTDILDPINPNHSGTINIKHDYPIYGGINDPDNPNFSGDINIAHGSFKGSLQHSGNLNVPIAGGMTDPDNPNNFGMIKLIHNFPIAGGITDPDNPNYPGNLPHNFPVAGGITDMDNSNHSSKINIINGNINVPVHNSGKFNVPLNVHSEVNNRPNYLINPGTNLINTEKILDFNIPANKAIIPGYDWESNVDSIVDDREVNLPEVFHTGKINIPNDELHPGINITSTETFVSPSISLNPVKEISLNRSISIKPPVPGELVTLVNVNPELTNEPNDLTSPGMTIQKILDSDKNEINEVTVNGTLNPLNYDGNVNASIKEKNKSGTINIAINNLTNAENKNGGTKSRGTLNGKVKISSDSNSKVNEPNNTLKPDLEINRTEKNKHSSSPVNSVTKIISHEDINDNLNHNVKVQVPGNIQQINPEMEISSDPINTIYKEINYTIPGGINKLSDLLHFSGVHNKQLGNIPEEAQNTYLHLISDYSRHDNYEFGSFDDWLNHQISTSDSTLNIETIRKLTEKILRENGIRIDKQGVLTDFDGNVFNLSKLKLVPLLIGSPVGYDTIIQNGYIYKNKINLPRNMRYKNSALIAFDDPFRILGIIPLGLPLNTDKRLALDSKFMKLKTPIDGIKNDRTSYLPSTTIKSAALPDLTRKPESPINYIQSNRRPCADGNCFSHRIVPGIKQEKGRIYLKTNDANTKIIYLNEPTDERKSMLSAMNFDQGTGEIIPVVQNMTWLLKKLIADIDSNKRAKDVTEPPKEPEKPPPDYDEIPGFRIIGGNAATSSGTPVSSRGRSGIIT